MSGLNLNRTLIQKADLQLSDLQTDGGLLVDEQAQKFMRILILRSVLMEMSTVEPMRAPRKELDKINFAGRILRAGQSGVALGINERAKPDLSKVTLDAKLFKAEVRLNNETLEDSIEQGNLKNTVMQEMAKAIARDMEDILVNGDTASASPFYSQFDGVLKQASSNIVNATGSKLTKSVLRDLQKALPNEFLVAKNRMKYLTSVDAEIDYRDSISDRATALGDSAFGSGSGAVTDLKVGYGGIEVVPVPLFPENLGVGSDETNVLFLDTKNIHTGIYREIRMETDKDVSAGEMIIVVSMRFDVRYAHEPAVAKAIGVQVGL